MAEKRLTPQQEKFCQLYHKTGNARQSYIDAGYKYKDEKVADACSSRLLTNAKVQEYLATLKNQTLERHKLTIDELIQENVRIAFAKLSNVIEVDSEGNLKLKLDADLDELDGISFTKSESLSKDGQSITKSISVKRPDRLRALKEIAILTGAYEKSSKPGDSDSGDNKANAARAILDAFARLGKKQ